MRVGKDRRLSERIADAMVSLLLFAVTVAIAALVLWVEVIVVVCKAKIWLVGCDGWLAVVKPANTSFTSWHLGGDSGIAGHGQLGLVDQQKI
jgi:hypothetical protein